MKVKRSQNAAVARFAARRSLRVILLLTASLSLLTFTACRTPQTPIPEVDAVEVAAAQRAQREAFLLADAERQARLHRVAYPVLRIATEVFELEPRPALGVILFAPDSFPPPYTEVANELWALDESILVKQVAPGSPAEEAGLRPGDRLVGFEGATVPPSEPAFLDELHEAIMGGDPITLRIRRPSAEAPLLLAVTPEPIAPYRVQLRYDSRANALATGRAVQINRGMLDFCQSDTELAFIIAHEIAHNALKHHRDYTLNYLLGTLGDAALIAAGIPSPNALGVAATLRPAADFETEADLVALALLYKCGADLDELRGFWTRFATLGPEVRRKWWHLPLSTHPDHASRQVRMDAAITALLEKPAP